jgi:LmbE family N-acetylglucosaminyl deacetylase
MRLMAVMAHLDEAEIRCGGTLLLLVQKGKIKVNMQWVSYCMVHNIGKVMSYGLA